MKNSLMRAQRLCVARRIAGMPAEGFDKRREFKFETNRASMDDKTAWPYAAQANYFNGRCQRLAFDQLA